MMGGKSFVETNKRNRPGIQGKEVAIRTWQKKYYVHIFFAFFFCVTLCHLSHTGIFTGVYMERWQEGEMFP